MNGPKEFMVLSIFDFSSNGSIGLNNGLYGLTQHAVTPYSFLPLQHKAYTSLTLNYNISFAFFTLKMCKYIYIYINMNRNEVRFGEEISVLVDKTLNQNNKTQVLLFLHVKHSKFHLFLPLTYEVQK